MSPPPVAQTTRGIPSGSVKPAQLEQSAWPPCRGGPGAKPPYLPELAWILDGPVARNKKVTPVLKPGRVIKHCVPTGLQWAKAEVPVCPCVVSPL